jgi:hypothetical protein
MEKKDIGNTFVNKLREDTASIWALMNDTEIFLSRHKIFHEYERDFREWRSKLQRFHLDNQVRKEIKESVVALRKALRLQGYDLKFGSKDVQCFGFKSDDAPLEGYKRLVVVLDGVTDIYHISGDDNHRELQRYLELRHKFSNIFSFNGVHNLWYRWKDNILQLCGADSETKEDFELFKKYVEVNKNLVLKKLRGI